MYAHIVEVEDAVYNGLCVYCTQYTVIIVIFIVLELVSGILGFVYRDNLVSCHDYHPPLVAVTTIFYTPGVHGVGQR